MHDSIRKLVIAAASLGLAGCLEGCANDPPELPFASELQEALDRVLQVDEGNHEIGISAAVQVSGYETWLGVSGNSCAGVPITPDMLFDAGSIAKTFEAALMLKLSERGLLDLDDEVSRWLPPLRNVAGNITIRQLLNHSSGVFNVFEHPDFPWARADVDYARRWDLEDVFDAFVLDPYGPPGTVQHYSSTNYLLITAIAERAGGATVPVQVQSQFLDPLGLAHTVMSMGEPEPAGHAVAHPWFDADLDGDLEDMSGTPYIWIASLTHPMLRTTAEDLARWIQALYVDRSILTPRSTEQMLAYPEVSVPDPEGTRCGLGVIDFSEVLGVPAIGHGGSTLGYSAAALYLPEHEAVLVWLVNTGESPPDLAGAIMGKTWSMLSEVLQSNVGRVDEE